MVPSCSPKKKKCTKGVNVNFDASNGCSVNIMIIFYFDILCHNLSAVDNNDNYDYISDFQISGKYKNTGKKQSFSGLSIDGFGKSWLHSWKNAQTHLCYFSGLLCYFFASGHASASSFAFCWENLLNIRWVNRHPVSLWVVKHAFQWYFALF